MKRQIFFKIFLHILNHNLTVTRQMLAVRKFAKTNSGGLISFKCTIKVFGPTR